MRSSITLVCVFFALASQAQSVFQFDIALPAGNITNAYSAMAVIQKNGQGQVRLKPANAVAPSSDIWEQVVQVMPLPPASQMPDTASIDLIYQGGRNSRIAGNGEAVPLFDLVFKLTNAQWMPHAIAAPGSNGKKIIATAQKAIWLEKNEIAKDVVLQYFLPQEDFYANQFVKLTRGLTAQEKLTRMHVLIVANTTDSAVGYNSKVGMENAEKVFGDIAETMGIKIRLTKIFGSSFSRDAVVNALKQLSPAAQDVVVFYYIGHGFRQANTVSPNPLLDLRSNNSEDYNKFAMSIDDVYRQIRAKGARVNIVLSDCCNWDVNKPLPYGAPDLQPRDSGIDFDIDKCKALFLPTTRMSILGVAADKNQLSVSNPTLGGFFFYYFSALLQQGISKGSNGQPNWIQILEETKSKTFDKSRNTYCSRPWIPQNICFQTPRYIME
jgi:Caspase domain